MPVESRRFQLRELALDEHATSSLRDAVDYWEAQRGGAFAPRWKDFDLLRFSYPMLLRCIVVDCPPGDAPLRYRYFGSGVAELHGMEMTNRTSDEIEPPELRRHVLTQYRTVVEGRRPRLFVTDIVVKADLPLQRLILRMPLSDDAERVTNVVTFDTIGDYGYDLESGA